MRSRLHTCLILVGTLANLGTVAFLLVTESASNIWPILACAIAAVANLSVLFIPYFPHHASLVGPPPIQQPAADPSPVPTAAQIHHPDPDDPLDNKPWVKLVDECVALFEELGRLRPSLDLPGQELGDHLCCRLQEILERSGVTVISEDSTFDRSRHQTAAIDGNVLDGTPIAETQSPGFAIGRRVFRRALVKLAEVATTEKGSTP